MIGRPFGHLGASIFLLIGLSLFLNSDTFKSISQKASHPPHLTLTLPISVSDQMMKTLFADTAPGSYGPFNHFPPPASNASPPRYVRAHDLSFRVTKRGQILALIKRKKAPLISVEEPIYEIIKIPLKTGAASKLPFLLNVRKSAARAHKKILLCTSCQEIARVSQYRD